ncbi:hypothetical protein like AT4G13630 [Hibiscus trionum]|uniref:GTD-binding domain-containing protein n=1 Tax=Hibiscus trionum TaxID=183268 RepID=A0A9W7IJA3_HIBTR|nr:hypothetical protein like AT4G13630 [Hibiscus trionum]
MACDAINSWTFISLLGAFLNLFIAYILLCGSAVAYSASKILGLFGLPLPCSCNGLFGYSNKNICVQAMLLNDPSFVKKLSFDSIWNGFHQGGEEEEDGNYSQSNSEKRRNGNVEMGGEASSSSWHEKKNIGGVENGSFVSIPEGPKAGHRRRKRAAVNSKDGKESLRGIRLVKRRTPSFEIDEESFAVAKKELAVVESQCGGDKNVIRVIEQALDEEHAGRTALYFELENERLAASTAADEAMAMILRLQDEKASIEMEAKQYLRMIEEKTAFDAEEMNILKEILLRREREKLFLEKEVEAYKQMFFDKDQLDTDVYDTAASQEQMTSNEEPVLMFEQIPQSIGEKCEITSIVSSNRSLGKELPIPGLGENASSMNSTTENKPITSNSPKTCDYPSPTSYGSETEIGRKRNSSDRSGGLPPIAPSSVKSLPSISRGNSMPAFDYEKFKIDNEVELLRERLRIIQQGREQLNIPAGPKESQLRQKRQLSVPGKALTQASLPPPSSKVMSKKRHQRGAPLAAMRSI